MRRRRTVAAIARLAGLLATALAGCSAGPPQEVVTGPVEMPARDAPAEVVPPAPDSPPPPTAPASPPAQTVTPAPAPPATPALPPAPVAETAAQRCGGVLTQGGLVICHGAPGDVFTFGQVQLTADASGTVQFGLPRTAGARLRVVSRAFDHTFDIQPRTDEIRVVTGLDCDKVDARTPAQKAHAAASWEKKQAAFRRFEQGPGALRGFIPPTDMRPSSPFGPVRRYTGVSKTSGEPCSSESVHQGQDYATPVGTPVRAPAPGVVTLADPDLYYEGGAVFIDHGHGLLTVFMHLSDVKVAAGDIVKAGDVVAASGNTGRSSGPHLHWGVKWRNPYSDDRSGDVYVDPVLLLSLAPQ